MNKPAVPPPPLPSPERILELEIFEGLPLEAIHVPRTAQEADEALRRLLAERELGFDTESKPTFTKHEVSTGPHLVQFATRDAAWLFQVQRSELRPALAALLESKAVRKVGFGLSSDLALIRQRLGIEPGNVLDLDHEFRRLGHRRSVGVKTAIALLFERRFLKSRKATTSNWARSELSESQRRYAANDAYAALRGFDALGLAGSRQE